MKIKVKNPKPNIVHLKFKRQTDITSSLVRFQEHFESPKFMGKFFTLNKFKKWYSKQHKGKFTYYKDWTGYNFPSSVVESFRNGKFDPLRRKEHRVLNLLKQYNGKFYVIGTYTNGDLRHEMAHAFYYLNPKYRAEVKKIVNGISKKLKKKMHKMLKKDGYDKSVFADEIHAYLLEKERYIKKKLKLRPKLYGEPREALMKIFDKYA